MARKPTLSPSRITTYLACPVKYRWTYLDPRGRWYMKAKSYYSFGTTLHRVLERFHDSSDTGVSTVDEAVAAMEESWIDAGYGSAEEMAEAQGEGKAILERYVEEFVAAEIGGKNLFVEKTLGLQFERFKLVGRIDRIDELADGTIEIIDYKSGRSDVTPEEVATDIALCCYQLLVRELYPDRDIRATIVALRTGARASSSLSQTELEEFKRDLEFLGNEILETDFEDKVPVAKDLCGRCDFLPLCHKHPDFDYVSPSPE